MSKRRRRRLGGSPKAHRRDAEQFLRNTRRALADFSRLMNSGNCHAAFNALTTAHLRASEYTVSKEYAAGKRQPIRGLVTRMVGADRRFKKSCVRN